MRDRTIYVAGGSSEAALVSSYMRRLEAAGWIITYDWTVPVLDFQGRGIPDVALTINEAITHSSADAYGVQRASVVWLIAPLAKSEGSWFELGYALGLREARTLVSGPTHNIFRMLSGRIFTTHDEALAWLVAL